MPKPRLTKKQRELVTDIRQMRRKHYLDPDEIASEPKSKTRTQALQNAKAKIISSYVILNYIVMEEQLNWVIRSHFFGKKRFGRQLLRNKHFNLFNHFLLERLYLLQKLDFVKHLHNIPKWVATDLAALNDLRNGLAHSLYLQYRRRQPEWKGQSIFTQDVFDRYCEDMKKLFEFFVVSFWPVARKGRGDKS